MSDRYAAQITIGGEIQQKDLTGLFKAIAYEGISTEWDGDPFQPQHEKEILGVLNKDGHLRLCDRQVYVEVKLFTNWKQNYWHGDGRAQSRRPY
jgi:hypothetical protein